MTYMVRWQTGLHKSVDGTVMQKAGEWRYLAVEDGWQEGAWAPNAGLLFSTRQAAEDAAKSVEDDAKAGERICTWYHAPDRKKPVVEIIEVEPLLATIVVGYQLKNDVAS